MRPGSIVAWVAGFLLYEWLYQPTDLGFWSDWLEPSADARRTRSARRFPSFALAFALMGAARPGRSARVARARHRVIATVLTVDGAFGVDLETEEVVDAEPGEPGETRRGRAAARRRRRPLRLDGGRGARPRPPVVVSHDAGSTWREAGGGLPPGKAVAVSPTTIRTSSSTRPATACMCRATAAASGRALDARAARDRGLGLTGTDR